MVFFVTLFRNKTFKKLKKDARNYYRFQLFEVKNLLEQNVVRKLKSYSLL